MAIPKTLDCGEPLTVVTSTSFGLVFTFGLIAFIPLTIGVLVDGYGFSLEQAGLVGSVEIASMTLAGLIVALYAQHVSRARLAQIGCILGLLGNLLVLVNSTFYALLLCRIIVGVGIGLITGAVNFSTASSSNAERLYAVSTTGYGVILVVLFFIAPLVYTEISYPAYFVFFSIMFLLGIYLTRWLLDATPEQLGAVEKKHIHFETLLNPRLLGLYAATLFLWIGLGIVWAISERMGVSIGLTPQEAGLVIATSNAIGLLGSVVANVMGTRFGYARPLLLCVGVLSLAYASMAASQSMVVWGAAFTLYNLGYYFMIPYVLGTAAQYDESGRAATISALMSPVAHIITPSLGVYIVATHSFQAVNVTALILAVISGMLFVPIGNYIDRRSGYGNKIESVTT